MIIFMAVLIHCQTLNWDIKHKNETADHSSLWNKQSYIYLIQLLQAIW